ncbi:MAG: class I SAM-dependent methyltransferase, partial [Alphaproteobacteria bacterium]
WAWRGYNEQLGLAALLLGGGRYRPLFASHYVSSRMAEALADTVVARLPLVDGAPESSLWLEKR